MGSFQSWWGVICLNYRGAALRYSRRIYFDELYICGSYAALSGLRELWLYQNTELYSVLKYYTPSGLMKEKYPQTS